MSDSSKRSIPSWQQKQNTQSPGATTETPTTEPSTSSHAELLEQARDFLKDESIQSASREKKVAFLEKKGLGSDDIQQLLDSDIGEDNTQAQELKTVHDSNTTSTPEEEPTPSKSKAMIVAQENNSPSPSRDSPPIITYPEFLLKPQKPPPLVTVDRLLNAVYGIAGVTALSYGASRYIVQPMLSILTEARHDLATTTLQDLTKLNDKLMSTVSHVPYIPTLKSTAHLSRSHSPEDLEDDTLSMASDPTEFFHRDIATQTSPPRSRSSSPTFSTQASRSASSLTYQLRSLSTLHTHLDDLLTTALDDTTKDPYAPPTATARLQESMTQLQSVLDKLEHTSNPLRSEFIAGSSGNVYQSPDAVVKKGGAAAAAATKGADEATKFKAEIRALKGAFLSSRNFPMAGRPAAVSAGGMAYGR